MQQQNRGAQNAERAADHRRDRHRARHDAVYSRLHSRLDAGLQHMDLGSTIRDTSSSALSVKVAQSGEAATRSVVRRCCSAIVFTQFARRAARKREAQQGGDHGWPGYPAVDT